MPRLKPRFPKLKRRPRTGPPLKEQIWNLPNIITYFRIILIPFVIILLYQCQVAASPADTTYGPRYMSFWATILLAVACITDFLDGWIARNWGLSTAVGRFLDPLADKLLVIACLVMAVYLDRVPAWFVVLLISRELSITSLRSIASAEGLEVQIAQSGKWKTAFQMLGLVGVLIHYEYHTNLFFYEGIVNYNRLGLWLLSMSLVFSISSAFQYFHRFAVAAALVDSSPEPSS